MSKKSAFKDTESNCQVFYSIQLEMNARTEGGRQASWAFELPNSAMGEKRSQKSGYLHILFECTFSANTKKEKMGVALTHNGQNHNNEVKDVPPNGEVVVPQGEHLQHTLAGEEDDKHQVDPVEDVLHLLALCVCLHHHGHHVEADEHHDDDVECLLSDKVKDSSLNAVLCNRREAVSQTGWNKNLPSVNRLLSCW